MVGMAEGILRKLKPSAPDASEKEKMADMAEGILKHLRPGSVSKPESNSAKDAAKKQLLGAATSVQNTAQTSVVYEDELDHALY